jgi:flagellar motility protein MotE (MotC chaperone)
MENVRVMPLLVFAGLCLFVLKAMGLLLSGSYVLSGVAPASAQNPPAASDQDKTAKATASQGKPPAEPEKPDAGTAVQPDTAKSPKTANVGDGAKKQEVQKKSARKASRKAKNSKKIDVKTVGPRLGDTNSELAVLKGLSNRRKTLDKRAREIDLRENLLKAVEKRIEARITELKSIEARIEGELKKGDENRKAQYERLVKMYAGMKPKDAARIFDRLDMNVLTGLVSQMKPRIMSAILAAMTPAAAERLTLEIANRGKTKVRTAASLPKIQSQ